MITEKILQNNLKNNANDPCYVSATDSLKKGRIIKEVIIRLTSICSSLQACQTFYTSNKIMIKPLPYKLK